jgi:hypothetical protein
MTMTMTPTTIDDEGRCPCHPFVQLSRISPRTGEWKALLDGCPLCAMDGKSTADSVSSQQFNEKKADANLFASNTSAATGARPRGRKPMPPPPPRRSRSSSRVRFQPDKDVQFTATTAVTRAKSVLRASPRYKVCEVLMQQQLDESVKVTTMSMDMGMDFSTHDDEDSGISLNHTHNEERHDEQMEDKNEDEKMQLSLPLLPSLIPPSLPHGSENDSKETSTRNQDDQESESTDGSQKQEGGRRSYQQVQAVQLRPDPDEEFLPDDISGCGSQTSSSQRQRGRREVGVGGEQRTSRSASLTYQTQRLKLPPPQLTNSMQILQPSSEGSARNNHHLNHWQQQQPLYTNMVISPEPNDDEVSALTFMGQCVRSTSDYSYCHPASICENSSEKQDEHSADLADDAEPVSVLSLSKMIINTSDFDPKTGRCIHHDHIRLRKKKLFGKGWKVLMSACPDCCVDELRRLRSVEENNMKNAKTKMIPSSSTKMTPPPPSRRSPSQDIYRGSPPLPPMKDKMHIEHDETTASLTGSSSASNDGLAIDNSNRTDVSSLSQEEEDLFQVQEEIRGAIHVRQMRWTDPKTGQSGTYTGQVNDRFVPHGCGTMEYDPNPNNDMSGLGVSVVLVKDGEWKDGRFRRNRHRSRGSSVNVNAKRSSSFYDAGSEGNVGDRLRSSSVRSRSTGRRHSSDISGQSQQRQRSLSRSARQVSF